MVEGAPLLREYGPKVHRGFESLSLQDVKKTHAPVAQLDRVSGYEPEGRRFESFRARKFQQITNQLPATNTSLHSELMFPEEFEPKEV